MARYLRIERVTVFHFPSLKVEFSSLVFWHTFFLFPYLPFVDRFLYDNCEFYTGCFQHVFTLLFFFLLGIGLIYIGRNYLDEKGKHRLGNVMACTLSLTIILWTAIEIYLGKFTVQESLPLFLCNIMALFMPIFTLTRNRTIYEIIVFWILGGTFQGIITPDLVHAFPHYWFFKYWIGHAGLIVMIFYATYVYELYPTKKSIFKSFGMLQVYFLMVILINYLLDANYLYLNEKPQVATLLDHFGPWPLYILVVQLIVIPVCYGVYYALKGLNRVLGVKET